MAALIFPPRARGFWQQGGMIRHGLRACLTRRIIAQPQSFGVCPEGSPSSAEGTVR
jgi:hypothetical protein